MTQSSDEPEEEGHLVHKFYNDSSENKEGPNENPTAAETQLLLANIYKTLGGGVKLNSVDGQHSQQLSTK